MAMLNNTQQAIFLAFCCWKSVLSNRRKGRSRIVSGLMMDKNQRLEVSPLVGYTCVSPLSSSLVCREVILCERDCTGRAYFYYRKLVRTLVHRMHWSGMLLLTLKCAVGSVLVGCVSSVRKGLYRSGVFLPSRSRAKNPAIGSALVGSVSSVVRLCEQDRTECTVPDVSTVALGFDMCLDCCTAPLPSSYDHASAERKHSASISSLPACANLSSIEK